VNTVDQQLWDQCKDSSISPASRQEAFNQLIGTTFRLIAWNAVRRYLKKGTLHEEDAEDVVQNALLLLYSKSDAIDHPVSWLYGAVRLLSRRAVTPKLDGPPSRLLDASWDLADPTVPDEESLLLSIQTDLVVRHFYTLPQSLAQVISYRLFDDISFREIAGICRKNPSTIRKRWRHARRLIQEAIGKPGSTRSNP
jgi:RNA polymerase sigma factor (sigma-70 family)